MNLRDLHYFVVLAQVSHFGEAARQCHISQPTLSMQIKKLEEELGVCLFERTNKQVMLTDEGKQLLPRARIILNEAVQMKELARSLQEPGTGDLKLGIIPTLAPYLLPLIMPSITEAFPHLRIWLIEEQTHKLVEKLAGGELDAAFMATPVLADFPYYPLFDEPFYFVCGKNYPTSLHEPLELNQLANQPVMLLTEGHCLREQAMDICRIAKAITRTDFTATSLETLRLMVQSGMGATLMPALAMYNNNSERLRTFQFAKPVPVRHIALFWREHTVKLKLLQTLGALIKPIIYNILLKMEQYG